MKQVTAKQVKIEGLTATEQSMFFGMLAKIGKIKVVGKASKPAGQRGKQANIYEMPDTIKIPVVIENNF